MLKDVGMVGIFFQCLDLGGGIWFIQKVRCGIDS